MKNAKVIIVDDHSIFRRGMKLMLEEMDIISSCKEAESGDIFLEMLKKEIPDIVLMDIEMPNKNGIETTIEALKKYPNLKILAISMHSDEEYYYKMVEAGVKGFIPKNTDYDELESAVKKVLGGDTFFSNELLRNIIVNIRDNTSKKREEEKIKNTLSDREKEVIFYLCKGLSTNAIAEQLNISPRTVDKHRTNLFSKYDLKNAIQLVIFSLKNNLVDIDKV